MFRDVRHAEGLWTLASSNFAVAVAVSLAFLAPSHIDSF